MKEARILNRKLITPSRGTKQISNSLCDFYQPMYPFRQGCHQENATITPKNKNTKTLSQCRYDCFKILGIDQYSKKVNGQEPSSACSHLFPLVPSTRFTLMCRSCFFGRLILLPSLVCSLLSLSYCHLLGARAVHAVLTLTYTMAAWIGIQARQRYQVL